MKLYSERECYKLYEGNMLDMLEVITPNSIDAIITDPPYGLTSITKRFGKENSVPAQHGKDGSFARLTKGFMGKAWDGSGIEYNVDAWRKCYEALKPGGYLLAFGGTRTFHRIACAIEDAGFEIRDTIMWLYGSGFPKSLNIGFAIDKANGVKSKVLGVKKGTLPNHKDLYQPGVEATHERVTQDIREANNEWNGWQTCLKPAYEPIIVARKPLEKSVIQNVLKYRVGGLNIDECRVEASDEIKMNIRDTSSSSEGWKRPWMENKEKDKLRQELAIDRANSLGRYPSNVILTYDESDYDEVCGGMPNTNSTGSDYDFEKGNQDNPSHLFTNIKSGVHYEDEGSASRYFYNAKASQKDRDEGLDEFEEQRCTSALNQKNGSGERLDGGKTPLRKNVHPTVKPCELMQYLIRLVAPKGATILDCFNGSGSTGKAVMWENRERNANYKYIGIELTEEYLPISKARIEYVLDKKDQIIKQVEKNENGEEEVKSYKIQNIFDMI